MTGPGEPEDPDGNADTLRVPDDISALAADVLALRREEAARRRRQRLDRATGWVRRLRWYGVSVPVVVAALLVVGGLGAMLVVLSPHGTETGPLGGSTSVAGGSSRPGTAGAPIAPVTLVRADGAQVPSTSLVGPAVVLLVPAGCGCEATVDAVRAAAVTRAVTADVVTTDAPAAGSDELRDAGGVLLRSYGRTGDAPTLLHLAAGVVDLVWTGLIADRAALAVGAR